MWCPDNRVCDLPHNNAPAGESASQQVSKSAYRITESPRMNRSDTSRFGSSLKRPRLDRRPPVGVEPAHTRILDHRQGVETCRQPPAREGERNRYPDFEKALLVEAASAPQVRGNSMTAFGERLPRTYVRHTSLIQANQGFSLESCGSTTPRSRQERRLVVAP